MQRKQALIICPKCDKLGFLSVRWARSSYYPKYVSLKIMLINRDRKDLARDPTNFLAARSFERLKTLVRGTKYRGKSRKHLSDYIEEDKRLLYRTTSDKYGYFYIGHYDAEIYQQKMKDYKNGKIKWRPNGRRWCKVPSRCYEDPVFKYHIDNLLKKHKRYVM